MLSRRAALLALAGGLMPVPLRAAPQAVWSQELVAAARRQVGVTTIYDPAYVKLAFPGGDVPPERGVCTDVIVRAYRAAFGTDLQHLLNRDMKAMFSAYPTRWGLRRPDPNIDHRRVPNLQVYFARRGAALQDRDDVSAFRPGDLVTQMLPGNLPHIGIVSDKLADGGTARRLVIHNVGAGTREEDILLTWPRTGHYRLLPSMLV